jgi:hypothetical protein
MDQHAPLYSEQSDTQSKTDCATMHAPCRSVSLLKIDVERAELQVLAGMGADDWRMVDQVAMEAHAEAAACGGGAGMQGRLGEVQALLAGVGGFGHIHAEQDAQLARTTLYNVYATRQRRM